MSRRETRSLPFNIFLSSKDRLADERAAAESAIADINMIPVRVETTTWFATPIPDEYLHQVQRCQMVILLLAPVDTATVTPDYYRYVREEIDLAFLLGKTVLLFIRDNRQSSAQDEFLESVQYKVFSQRFSDTTELYRLVQLSVLNELVRRYTHDPLLFKGRRQFGDFSAGFVRETHARLVVSQDTPTLLFGPRVGLHYERALYDAILDVVRRSAQSGSPDVTILFNMEKTERELRDRADEYEPDRFSEYCEVLRPLISDRFAVVAAPNDTMPYLVVDNRYAIGQSVGKRTLVMVNESPFICKELCEIAKTHSSEQPGRGVEIFADMVAAVEKRRSGPT